MIRRDRTTKALRRAAGSAVKLEQMEPRRLFDAEYPYPVLQGGGAVVADFDADGDPDLVTLSGRTVFLHLNDGIGGFESITSPRPDNRLTKLIPADLNGDGYLDLVWAASWGVYSPHTPGQEFSRLRAFVFQPETRTFVNRASMTVGGSFRSVVVGQLDDGVADEVVLVTDINRVLQFDSANEQWIESADLQLPVDALSRVVAGGDLNGDGLLDFVRTQRTNSNTTTELVAIFRTPDGPEAYSEPMLISLTPGWLTVSFVADIDGDGDLDVVGTSNGPDAEMHVFHVLLFTNTGAGEFEDVRTLWRQRAAESHQLSGTADAAAPGSDGRSRIYIQTRDLSPTVPYDPLRPYIVRERAVRLSVDESGTVSKERLPLASRSARDVGDLTPMDGQPNSHILWTNHNSRWTLVHDLNTGGTTPMPFGQPLPASGNRYRFGNGSALRISGGFFDPRIFDGSSAAIRTTYAVFLDTNANGIIDEADIRLGQRRVNPRKDVHPSFEVIVTDDLPRGRFALLAHVVGTPGDFMGPTWQMDRRITII